MNLSIRPAEKEDLPEVLRLYAQHPMDNGKVLPLHQAEALFERLQRYPDYRVYVAESNTKAISHKNSPTIIVGTFELLIMDNLGHHGTPTGIVEAVAVDPAWQGHGIGKAMMQYAHQHCQDAGCYKMALSSNLKRTEAHSFYDALGFEKHGISFRINISA